MRKVEIIREKGKTSIIIKNETSTWFSIWNRILSDEEVKLVVEAENNGKHYPEDFKNEDL